MAADTKIYLAPLAVYCTTYPKWGKGESQKCLVSTVFFRGAKIGFLAVFGKEEEKLGGHPVDASLTNAVWY